MRHLIYITLLFLAWQTNAQKQVHFVHGLGGNSTRWAEFETELNAKCTNFSTTNANYTSPDGLLLQAEEVKGVLSASGATVNDIAIGSSSGGQVLRAVDDSNNSLFGGSISIGSQHQGTKLANSVLDGTMENYLEHGCFEAVNGPAQGISLIADVVPFLNLADYAAAGVQIASLVLCHNLFETVIKVNMLIPDGGITGSELKTIIDLQLNSTSGQLPLPSHSAISITTQEISPIHWNLLSDGSDTDVVEFMENATNIYRDVETTTRNIAALLPSFMKKRKSKLLRAADKFRDARLWIGSSEDGWLDVIGAAQGGTFVVTSVLVVGAADAQECIVEEDCPTGYYCERGYCIKDGVNPCDETGGVPTTIDIKEWIPNEPLPNDGVVLVSSQHVPGEIDTRHFDGLSHWNQSDSQEVHDGIKFFMSENNTGDDVFYFEDCNF